jgi:energy-coupling factor transporter ATP-binding protein EcfA2
MNIAEVRNLTFAFNHQSPVLNRVTVNFPAQQTALLTGPSGCGKSTFLRLLAGLLPKYGGQVSGGQITFPSGQPTIGMLFQDPLTQFALDTPRHELEFVLENQRVPHAKIVDQVQAALDFCQITDLANRKITSLSGGQQQRVALAVIIARQADILLLDEPFANIDEANRQFLMAQLGRLVAEHGVTLIIADHDCHGYQDLAPRIYDFTDHHVVGLSPAASHHRLAAADKAATRQLVFAAPQPTAPTAFKLNDVSLARGNHQLLNINQLAIVKDKITLITGPNGTGKSTFFQALTKLIPFRGQITYQGHSINHIKGRRYRQAVGLVCQRANDQFIDVTVKEELELSAKNGHHPYFKAHLQDALKALGLNNLGDRVVYSLSGGQRKKLQLLVMLMMGQEVLLLDEPFAGLDHASLQAVFQLIQAAQATKPQTILIISHQLDRIDQLADFHLILHDQRLTYQEAPTHES